MKPHPDFSKTDLPMTVTLGAFELTPLSPAEVEEDYEAVMASATVLKEVSNDWPAGLTLEDNAIDLAWHYREFTERRSFAWIIRDKAGTYLGCAYIYPEIGGRGAAEIRVWFVDRPDRADLGAAFYPNFSAWLDEVLPSGLSLAWVTTPAI